MRKRRTHDIMFQAVLYRNPHVRNARLHRLGIVHVGLAHAQVAAILRAEIRVERRLVAARRDQVRRRRLLIRLGLASGVVDVRRYESLLASFLGEVTLAQGSGYTMHGHIQPDSRYALTPQRAFA